MYELFNMAFWRRKYNLGLVRNYTDGRLDAATHKVNNLEKRFLVWTGKYKTIDEVPALVQQSTMERARNRIRIRVANIMMATTLLGCLVMVYVGKKAAARGESVIQDNLEWHRQNKEKAQQSK